MRPAFRFLNVRYHRKASWLVVAIFLFFVWNILPVPLKVESSNTTDWPTPKYDVAEKPRFLYRSRFRNSPDHDFEARVDNSLRMIEEKIMSTENGTIEARDTLWQIMLSNNERFMERSPDSVAFEAENEDWEYRVRRSIVFYQCHLENI